MKQVVPGAGKTGPQIFRRRLLQGGLAGLLASAFGVAAAEPAVVSPLRTYIGARILRRVDPQGMPDFRADAFGPMTMFVFPVAVAATPFDLYIADAGLSTLFRYDPAQDAMATVPGVQVTQQTRIAAVEDGSVVVADGRRGVPRRFSRAGRQLQNIAPENTGGRFDDVVVDYQTGRYIGLDRIQHRIEEVHPLGRSSTVLPENLLPLLPTAMALDKQTLYAAGQDCQCVVAVDLFKRSKEVLLEDLPQVAALAAAEGWLVIADAGERVLRVYRDKVLRADPDYASLQLMNPQGMAISQGILYVADAGSRRIASFRLRS